MYAMGLKIGGVFLPKDITVDINAYWITIYRDGKEIYKMTPDNPDWYQGEHKTICQGLTTLEYLIERLCK